MKLYCKKEIKARTKFEFLEQYFLMNCPATFNDEEFTSQQCYRGRGRSFEDLHSLLKTRFSSTTKVDTAHILIELLKKYDHSKEIFIGCILCSDAKGTVFHANEYRCYGELFEDHISRNNVRNTINGWGEDDFREGYGRSSFYDIIKLAVKHKKYETNILQEVIELCEK